MGVYPIEQPNVYQAQSFDERSRSTEVISAVTVDLSDQILRLAPGGHLCLFYEKDPAEQLPALIPFIRDGLLRNEQFIYIADDQTVDELAGHLRSAGIDVAGESQSGRLKLYTRKEWRQPGELDSHKKAEQVRQFVDQAIKDGFKGIRFAVEMTWTLGPDIDPHQLEHWEATLNTLSDPGFPSRVICQYNRSRLNPDALMAALHTHPRAIINQTVCSNPFFEGPLILNGDAHDHPHAASDVHAGNGNGNGKASPARLDWMLSQLREGHDAEKARVEAEVLRRTNREFTQLEEPVSISDYSGQEAPHEYYRFLAAIVESSDDAIITKDLNGTITSWNQAAERLFGYTAGEAIGKPVSMLIPEDRRDEEPNILGHLRKGQRIDHYETVRRRKDGSLLNISLTVSPVRDREGRIMGASKIARDITELKNAERKLREAKEELSLANSNLEKRVEERTASLREAIAQMEEFSYSVSHDLRAPVRAMKGYAQATLEDYGDCLDAKGHDFLDRIIRGSTRMERLIHDVLTYSRLARCDIQIQPVSLQKLLPDIIDQYPAMQPPRAKIMIREPLDTVLAHEPSLTQGISNLLSNGVKFVAPGTTPELQVWTEKYDGKVRLWIEDNGIGIKPEHQRRLFGMFERVHQDTNYDGTGIGLAIVRKAVEKMGGTAGVESDGITGSSFWIELAAGDHQ